MNITPFLDLLPGNIGLIAACLIVLCKLITVTVRPPDSSSRWRLFYRGISTIALNIGWATNRFQVGRDDSLKPPKT